jgi:hypothetical protein
MDDCSLSCFKSATDPRPAGDLPLAAALDRIRGPELAEATARIRGAFAAAGGGDAGKKATAEAKRRLPAVTLAGTFDRRANAGWREPSGLVQIDLDNLGPADLAAARDRLRASPWVACLWASPSGAGIKGAVAVPGLALPDPSRYTAAWHAVTRWLASHGLVNDKNAKDAARLAFLAHDPEAWHNPAPAPFPLDDWAEPEPVAKPREPMPEPAGDDVEARARRYLAALPPSISDQGGHAALFRAAVALVHGFLLDKGAALALLREYNMRGDPESEEQLRHKIEQVGRHPHDHPRGWLLRSDPARDFAPADAEPWPTLRPLGEAAEPLPVDLGAMIPERLADLRAFIAGVARENQVDHAAVLPPALALASLAVSRWAEVAPYAPSPRTEPAPLWCCVLMDPAERKSGTLDDLRGAVWDWQRRERERLREPLAKYMEERKGMEARLAGLRAQMGRAKAGADVGDMTAACADLAADLDRMEPLTPPDLMTADATAEAVRGLLHRNGEKVAVVADEAAALEAILGRYSEGANLDVWLAMHAGSFAPAHRIGSGSMPLEHPAGSVCLLIQPVAVERVLTNPDAAGRGLLARFLWIKPASLMGRRELQPEPVAGLLRDWWANRVGALLDRPWHGRPTLGPDGPMRAEAPPRVLTLDPEAERCFLALRADVERRLGPDGDLAGSNGWGGKLPGAVARIALCLELLADPEADRVRGDTMAAACAWAPWLISHWRAVVGAAGDPHLAAARKAWRWIQRQGGDAVTLRDLHTACRCRGYERAEDWDAPLDLLEGHGLIRRGWDRTRRKPSAVLAIRPELVGQRGAA